MAEKYRDGSEGRKGPGRGSTASDLPRSWEMSLEALRVTSFLLAIFVFVLSSRTGIVLLSVEVETTWCRCREGWAVRRREGRVNSSTWGRGTVRSATKVRIKFDKDPLRIDRIWRSILGTERM